MAGPAPAPSCAPASGRSSSVVPSVPSPLLPGSEGRSAMQVLSRPPSGAPALVLNADFRPLSYYPLSLWPWQEVVKAVFLDRVDVISTYDHVVHSPSFEMRLPSVVALKQFVHQD